MNKGELTGLFYLENNLAEGTFTKTELLKLLSGATYELTKKEFNFKYRGKMQAKNKGKINTFS